MNTSFSPSPNKTNNAKHHLSPPSTPSRTIFSEATMQENIENAETIILKWQTLSIPNTAHPQFTSLFQENRQEAQELVLCVHGLRKAMHFLISQHPNSNKLVLANELMKMAMLRLEKEFHQILSLNKDFINHQSDSSSRSSRLSLSPQSSEDEDSIASIGEVRISKMVSDLKMIANTMISSGYSKECVMTYKTIRKSIIDKQLSSLGIDRCATVQMINRMDPETLHQQVNKWKQAAKTAIRTLFHGESFSCHHVFASSETIKQSCFSHVIIKGATNLFKFPENVAKSKRSPDKIFPVIDLYEAISDLWPEIQSIFSYEQISSLKIQALSIIHKLTESIQTMVSDFISSIPKNSSKTAVPGGGIHPLSISVMHFVSLLAEYSPVLSDIFMENAETAPFAFLQEHISEIPDPTSALSSKVTWIVLVLLCKLDIKAEAYNDVALSYLFLANNFQFVVQEIKTSSSLESLLGAKWLSKLETKARIYASKYEAIGWGKALSCLMMENQVEELSLGAIEECIKKFNSAFEEAYVKQGSWMVPNEKLRNEIKVSIARKIVPAYRRLYNYCLAMLSGEEGKNLEVLVRFSPDDLGNYLSGLFHSKGTVLVSGGSISRYGISRCL